MPRADADPGAAPPGRHRPRAATGLAGPAAAPPPAPVVVDDAVLQALKWLALGLMALDHAARFLPGARLPGAFEAGRLAMPLFGFVLACHLARPGARQAGVHRRLLGRLLAYGLLAAPAFAALAGWRTLDILFTLALVVALVHLAEAGGRWREVAAGALFVAGGAVVEFGWPGVLYGLAAWAWCRRPDGARLALLVLACAALAPVNGSAWALAALPLVWIAPRLRPRVRLPRCRHFFYAFYPAHLALLWALQAGPRLPH